MTKREIISYYIDSCRKTLEEDPRPQLFLERHGINHAAFSEHINLGFSDGKTAERIEGNRQLEEEVEKAGIVKNGKDVFAGSLIIRLWARLQRSVSLALPANDPYR
jgi:hypothetical protein